MMTTRESRDCVRPHSQLDVPTHDEILQNEKGGLTTLRIAGGCLSAFSIS
jgi:hypothetical protein